MFTNERSNLLLDQSLQVFPVVDFVEHVSEVIIIMVICLCFEIWHIVFEPSCFFAGLESTLLISTDCRTIK